MTTNWRRWILAAGLVLVLIGIAGVSRSAGPPPAATATTPPVAVAVRPSFLYASDGSTLIARFDAADPRQNCLTVKTNDWGFFCDYLVSWWEQQPAFGADPGARLTRLRTGGYRVVGSLDVRLQAAAAPRVRAVATPKVFSLVTVQPGTGLVRTMAVNRTFGPGARPSIASDADRGSYVANQGDVTFGPTTTAPFATGGGNVHGSPGEQTFEPFTLAAALEQGIPLSHTIDTRRRYTSSYIIEPGSTSACDGKHWCPSNSDGSSGKRDMWEALAGDTTTYFVPLQEQVGAAKVIDLAQRLGIRFRSPADIEQAAPGNGLGWGSFTLGASSTTALDLATAYATLAADGRHCDPRPVWQITDISGRPVGGASCTPAVSPDVARATMDAARCPVGDRPASGDRCGGGKGPAASVRARVGRPVAGAFGIGPDRADLALTVASPGLVTAGLIGDGPGPRRPADAATESRLIDAVSDVEAAGLQSSPARGFTPPSRELTGR